MGIFGLSVLFLDVAQTTFSEVKKRLEEIDEDPKIGQDIKDYLRAYYQKKQREVI